MKVNTIRLQQTGEPARERRSLSPGDGGDCAEITTQRPHEAEQLLTLYPDNILMNYLRIKSKLGDDADLIRQLNLVFENDVNFLSFKI